MVLEPDLDRTGYNHVLKNGNRGSLRYLERTYDQGVVGGKNSLGVVVDRVLDRNEIEVVNESREPVEDPPKVLYCHPSSVPYSSGFKAPSTYSGGSEGVCNERVADSAVLTVEEEPPIQNLDGLSEVETILTGDRLDVNLEGRGVYLQVRPQGVTLPTS